jgi:hypothetical protein
LASLVSGCCYLFDPQCGLVVVICLIHSVAMLVDFSFLSIFFPLPLGIVWPTDFILFAGCRRDQ